MHYIIAKRGANPEQLTIADVLRQKVDSKALALVCWKNRTEAEAFLTSSGIENSEVIGFDKSISETFCRNHALIDDGKSLKFHVL